LICFAVASGCGGATRGADADAGADANAGADAGANADANANAYGYANDTADASSNADASTDDTANADADVPADDASGACAYDVLISSGSCDAPGCAAATTVIDPAGCGLPDFNTPEGQKAATAFCNMVTSAGDTRYPVAATGGFVCRCCTA
jgi:hypothetical protein